MHSPPPTLIARQSHELTSSVFWLLPRPFEVEYRTPLESPAVKLLVTTGRARLAQGGRTAEVTAGTFTWLDPSAPHVLSSSEGSLLIARFSRRELRRAHPLLDLTPALLRGEGPAERIAGRVFSELLEAGRSLSTDECQAANRVVDAALGLCARLEPRAPSARHLATAVAFIRGNLRRPTFQTVDVAAHVGVSRRRLDALFREAFGVTVSSYVRDRRLEGATAQLLSHRDSIGALSRAWGFEDPSHFGRAFRRRHGRSPGAFRAAAPPARGERDRASDEEPAP